MGNPSEASAPTARKRPSAVGSIRNAKVILPTEAEQQSFEELLADNMRLKSIRMNLILREVEARKQLQIAKKKSD